MVGPGLMSNDLIIANILAYLVLLIPISIMVRLIAWLFIVPTWIVLVAALITGLVLFRVGFRLGQIVYTKDEE